MDFTKPQKRSVIDGKDSIIIDFNFHRKNAFKYNTLKERQDLLSQ